MHVATANQLYIITPCAYLPGHTELLSSLSMKAMFELFRVAISRRVILEGPIHRYIQKLEYLSILSKSIKMVYHDIHKCL